MTTNYPSRKYAVTHVQLVPIKTIFLLIKNIIQIVKVR